jgi:hypothetical protein
MGIRAEEERVWPPCNDHLRNRGRTSVRLDRKGLWQELLGTDTKCSLDAVAEARVALLAAALAPQLFLWRTTASA